ncbi:MAG: nitrous oxide reductase accessory protein NosL [Cyclobacteriaceae bacterium]
MKKIYVILLVVLFACKAEPEAIRYGTDACHTCKMTLMDKKFGGEIVTAKGKVYKFDDLNCMVGFITSDYLNDIRIEHSLVIDYANPEKLIPATDAFYLKSSSIRSPMGSGIAAFETREARKKVSAEVDGIELGWPEVITEPR